MASKFHQVNGAPNLSPYTPRYLHKLHTV